MRVAGRWCLQVSLFKFLASRFLLAPDQVLDCERVHARWQWLGLLKHNLRLPLMNAWLRLRQYLESHGMEFPVSSDIQPHLVQEAAAMRAARAAVGQGRSSSLDAFL